jgi:micrococcal nuclease
MAPLRQLLLAFFAVPVLSLTAAEPLTVKRVIDGDTLVLSNNEHIRLIGVDTPESRGGQKLNRDVRRTKKDAATIKALGRRASAFTKNIANGQRVRLEFDQGNAAHKHRDRYGRLLAYVYIEENKPAEFLENIPPDVMGLESFKDGFLNALLIEAGYGNTYTSFPFKYKNEFLNYERAARESNRGLWADEK